VGTQNVIASAKEEHSLLSSGVNYNHVFPTIVTNNKITLAMKDNFKTVSITDTKGQLLMLQQLTVQTGVLQLSLPPLSTGMYMIELYGNKTFRSKIFIR
jgi:hypothetical protein